jgi:hypothetical protein
MGLQSACETEAKLLLRGADKDRSFIHNAVFEGGTMNKANNGELGPGWDRAQLSLRLTPERKADLLALCDGLGNAPTPTDAIDQALEIARQSRIKRGLSVMDAEEFEVVLEAKSQILQASLAQQGRHIEDILASLLGLHHLMVSAVDGPFDDSGADSEESSSAAPTFRAWLERSIDRNGARAKRAVVVRSTWQRLRPAAPIASLELMAELVAVDGVVVQPPRPFPQLSRIDLLDLAHPFTAIDMPTPMFLVCQLMPNGWLVHAHRATLEGNPGNALGTQSI